MQVYQTGTKNAHRPSKGFSLVEVAVSMALISISVGVLLQMMGGTRVNSQAGNANNGFFASHGQLNAHKSHEYLYASSLADQLSSGGIDALNVNDRCGINAFPTATAPLIETGICTRNLYGKPLYFQWQIARAANAMTTPNTVNNTVPGAPVNLPDANYPTGNEYYRANLRMFDRDKAAGGQAPRMLFSYPITIFRNTSAPPPIQSNLISAVTMDTSGSMQESEDGLPRMIYAKESLREFINLVEANPYVSTNSRLSLITFNEAVFKDIGMSYPTNGQFSQFDSHIDCIMPDINACTSGTKIIPNGLTDLYNPMEEAYEQIKDINDDLSPTVTTNPLNSKRSYDRLVILVSDGEETAKVPFNDPDNAYPAMLGKAKVNGFNAARNDRITIMTIGLNVVNPVRQQFLVDMTRSTPYGIYIPTTTINQLDQAFENISNQFQFFALKHKPERWGVYL